jgi:ferritin
MISEKMQDAINKQIQAELYSSYLYLSMAAFSHGNNLKGFANWMTVQAGEERGHAMKFFDFLLERGGTVKLMAIEQPPVNFKSPLEIFQKTLDHERKVTGLINKLYKTAVSEDDVASQILLQWFITEQVEEEANATEILEKLKMVGDKPSGLLYLDKELKKRGAEK